MQSRIARSAYDALNITAGDVGPEHVRAAFLQLTKTFHPAKFARMAPEIQKLANEVFLGLRAAHDQLARPKSPGQRPSGPMPVLPSKTPPPPDARGSSGIRPNVPPAAPADTRGASGVRPNVAATANQRGVVPPATAPRPAAPPVRQGTAPIATTRPVTVVTPSMSQQIRRLTPAGGVPAIARTTVPTPSIGTARAPTPTTAAGPGAVAEPELAGVYELLQKGQWEQARTTLNALIALQPRPRYRALVQYSIGREAQLAQRVNEARVELQGALEIDPDLQLAKTALGELFTRRK